MPRPFQLEHRQYLKALYVARKSVPCMDCGQSYDTFVMDLDHVRGKKRGDVSRMILNHVSLDTLVTEMDKCEVVCSNCHRMRTFNRTVVL